MPGPFIPLLLGSGFIATLLVLNKREKDADAALGKGASPVAPSVPAATFPSSSSLPPLPTALTPINLPPLPGGFIQSTNIAPAPTVVAPGAAPLSQLAKNPDGSAHTLGTAFVDTSTQAALAAADLANRLGLAAFEVELLKTGSKLARVTTKDPAPSGDLAIRVAPNQSAALVPGGGAEKDGTVTLIRDVDGVFSEVFWRGGNRRPLAQGFAHRAFLTILPNPVTGS